MYPHQRIKHTPSFISGVQIQIPSQPNNAMISLFLFTLLLNHATALNLNSPTTQDISISVADASLNSLAKVLSVGGKLDWTGEIPTVNTSTLATLLPCAFKSCPNCPVTAEITVMQAPVVSFSQQTGASAQISGTMCKFKVNGTLIAQADANASTVLNFSQSTDNAGYIKVHASVVELYIDIEETCSGTISPALQKEIEGLVDLLTTTKLIPFINSAFPGIPIPTITGFELDNMTLHVMNEYLAVGIDVGAAPKLKPPTLKSIQSIKQRNLFNARSNRRLPLTHGDFNLNVSNTAINKALAIYLPTVIGQLGNIQVPAMSGKSSGVSWSTSSTTVENIKIGAATVSVLPNVGVLVKLSDIELNIPSTAFEVSKRIIINLHCGGHFSGSLSHTSVEVTMKILRDASGAPVVTPTSKWNWGGLNVNESLDHTVCKVIQDIAKLFVGSITSKIQNAIESQIPNQLNTIIANQGNQALAQLTQPVNVADYASVDLRLATNPIFTSNQIEISLLGAWLPPSLEVSLSTAAAVPSNFLSSHLDAVTAIVNQKYGNQKHFFSPIEIDACRYDPLHPPSGKPMPGGCLVMKKMFSITDIGFLNVVYAIGTLKNLTCQPYAVRVSYNVLNKTITKMSVPPGPFVGDVCEPLGISNTSRITLETALQLAREKAPSFNATGFNTINVRLAVAPCVSQASYIFTHASSNGVGMKRDVMDMGDVVLDGETVVGMTSRNVCRSLNTVPYANRTVAWCNKDHPPVCY